MLHFLSTSGRLAGPMIALLLGLIVLVGACSSSESRQATATTAAKTPTQSAPASQEEPTPEEEEEDAIAVRVETAVRESLSSLYHTSATLRADKTATVTARTGGVVQRLLVEEGDRVKTGQELAILENDEQRI